MKNCIVCGAPLNGDPLLRCSNMPASAQDIPTLEQLPQDAGIELNLHQCPGCGLVQFDCEPVSYYRDTIRAGGYSTTMAQLRREQYAHFIDLCNLKGKKIIEIGCGQGEFLQVLTEFPVEAYGIEHRADLQALACKKGLNVNCNFAEDEAVKLESGPFDAFLSFNFLEHQPNPNGMMRCIYENLTDGGYGLITVPSFEYILEQDGFYELLRDHIANYTQDSLRFLIEKNGFQMLECTRINRDTWAMIVQKRPRVDASGLLRNFDLLAQQVNAYLSKRQQAGKTVCVWGASHQGFTAVSTTALATSIRYIIDSAPFKQGKYAPASHVPIVSPDHFFCEPVDCILIIAPGYTQEIADTIRSKYGAHIEIAALRTAQIELLEE